MSSECQQSQTHTVLHLTFVHVTAACLCSNRKHINYTGLEIISAFITRLLCLSLLQGISVSQRTIFITLTLCASRSETWRPAPSYLRLPNLHRQVLYISLCKMILSLAWNGKKQLHQARETSTAAYSDQKQSAVWVMCSVCVLCCDSQRTMRRTERQMPAQADSYATSSPRLSSDCGPWELREWLTHHHLCTPKEITPICSINKQRK